MIYFVVSEKYSTCAHTKIIVDEKGIKIDIIYSDGFGDGFHSRCLVVAFGSGRVVLAFAPRLVDSYLPASFGRVWVATWQIS